MTKTVTGKDFDPFMLGDNVLRPIFAAVAQDIKAETRAVHQAAVAAGDNSMTEDELHQHMERYVRSFSITLSRNVRVRLGDLKDVPHDVDRVRQAFMDEAAFAVKVYDIQMISGSSLTPHEQLFNAVGERDKVLYKSYCERLAARL